MSLRSRRKMLNGVYGSPIPFYSYITWENNAWIEEWLTYPDSQDIMDGYSNRRKYGTIANKIRNDETADEVYKRLRDYPYIYFNYTDMTKIKSARVYVSQHPFLVIRDSGKWLVCGTSETKRAYMDGVQSINVRANWAFKLDGVDYYKCNASHEPQELDVIAFANHQILYVSP